MGGTGSLAVREVRSHMWCSQKGKHEDQHSSPRLEAGDVEERKVEWIQGCGAGESGKVFLEKGAELEEADKGEG